MIQIIAFLNKSFTFKVWHLLLTLLGVLLISISVHKCNSIKNTTNITTDAPVLVKPVEKTDKNGNKYEQIKENVYTEAQLKNITDSLKRVYKVSKVNRHVTLVDKIDTTFHNGSIIFNPKDSGILAVQYTKYDTIVIKGILGQNTDIFTLKLANDTIKLDFVEKDHLFRSNEEFVNFSHSNKLIATFAAESYTHNLRRDLVDFGVGVMYDILHNKVAIGPTLTLNIFTLSKSK